MKYSMGGRTYEVAKSGDNISVDGTEYAIEVLSSTHDGMEFLMDNSYHSVVYVAEGGGKMKMEVDGIALEVARETGLDEIVYKNSGGSVALTESSLLSQIPGKVVSVAVSPGDEVAEGDAVCVLESMKMQVSVRAQSDGRVKSVRAKVGSNIAKGDVIAEIE